MQDKSRDQLIICLMQDLDQYLELITDLACSVHKAVELRWIPKDDLIEGPCIPSPLLTSPLLARGASPGCLLTSWPWACTKGSE